MMLDGVVRDVDVIRLPRWGRVARTGGPVPWVVVDSDGVLVEPVARFLRDFVARGNAAGSVRSYCYALYRWWRFLRAIGAQWDRVTSVEVRDFVLWLQRAVIARQAPRCRSAKTAGRVNLVTRKQYPGDRYQARTVRHSNAVLRSFYDYWIELGAGPLVNPVPRQPARGVRPNAHHNPLEPYRAEGRLRYNPPVPKRRPRAMPDERWTDLFGVMRCNRDRALLALAVSTAARANELLGIRGADVDWGEQLVRVRRKGSGAQQWLPASPDAFVWLRLYLAEVGEFAADEPLWLTVRRRRRGAGPLVRQPLNYDALRAVLRRANDALGANWSMHDLRHTCALRMVRDQRLSLRDVQVILGHAHVTTTEIYLREPSGIASDGRDSAARPAEYRVLNGSLESGGSMSSDQHLLAGEPVRCMMPPSNGCCWWAWRSGWGGVIWRVRRTWSWSPGWCSCVPRTRWSRRCCGAGGPSRRRAGCGGHDRAAGAAGAPVLEFTNEYPWHWAPGACGRVDAVADRREASGAVDDPRLPDRSAAVQRVPDRRPVRLGGGVREGVRHASRCRSATSGTRSRTSTTTRATRRRGRSPGEELQRFLDYADEQVERAVRAKRKGALAAYRDATLVQGHLRVGAAPHRDVEAGCGRLGPQPGGAGVRPVRDAARPLRQGGARASRRGGATCRR